MMSSILMLAGAVARRFAGGGLFGSEIVFNDVGRMKEVDHIKGRKLWGAAFIALIAGILSTNILVVAAVLGGFYLNEIVGTSKIFDMYWDKKHTKESVVYAAKRGLLKLGTSSLLAAVTLNPWVIPIGILGALDGLWYWLGGQASKHFPNIKSVTVAEVLSGANYGLIIGLCI